MPTFPRSSLSFRTAGSLQYGWKVGFPSGAFLDRRQLKPASDIRCPSSSLHTSESTRLYRTVSGHRLDCDRHYSSTQGVLTRVRVIAVCYGYGTRPTTRRVPRSVWPIRLLSLAPDEQAGHRVVPDHAHQRTRRARKPPDRLLVVDRERHAHIGEQADAADEVESEQAAQDRKAL
jgi:hypothetical protein